MTERKALTQDQKIKMAATILMDRLANDPKAFHASLIKDPNDHLLEPLFKHLTQQDLVKVGDDDFYALTPKGQEAYKKLVAQRQSYLAHFEIFSMVDLGEGVFADEDDVEYNLSLDDRWSDLRVAVAEHKGIDPYQMVFLAMLADEAFFASPDWKANLGVDSDFFKELEEIVHTQITVEELGYTTEEGEEISGKAVIEDVILQGAHINRERYDRWKARQTEEERRQEEQARAGNGGGGGGDEVVVYYDYYDPYPAYGLYLGSALAVEAIWLAAIW